MEAMADADGVAAQFRTPFTLAEEVKVWRMGLD
jgi:hypothetical protein